MHFCADELCALLALLGPSAIYCQKLWHIFRRYVVNLSFILVRQRIKEPYGTYQGKS